MTDTATPDLLPVDDPSYRANPYPYYARLHTEAPAYNHPYGFWAITRYADVTELLFDRSLTVAQIDFGPASLFHKSPLGADLPDHGRLRKAISRWFTPRAVAKWQELAQAHLESCLDTILANGGTFDCVLDLAFPVTFRTICDILGVEPQQALDVRAATYKVGAGLSSNPTPNELHGVQDAMAWFVSHAEELITLKEQTPGSGLLDSFLQAERQGELSRDETIASLILLFAVGHLDISYLIVHGLHRFAQSPDITQCYRTDQDSRAAIIEELLRIDTPEQFVTRMTTQPIQVAGITIPAGEILLLMIGAANVDPEVFPQPEKFDHTRDLSKARHLAFGAGLHGCAGQVLARAEADLIFTTILERFGGVRSNGDVEYGHSDFIRSIKRLPLTLGTA
jgi:cytochrome P450